MKKLIAITTASSIILIVIIASLLGVAGFGIYKYRDRFIPNRPDTTAVVETTVLGNSTITSTLTIFHDTSTTSPLATSVSTYSSGTTTYYTSSTSATESSTSSNTTSNQSSQAFSFALESTPRVVVADGAATLTAVYQYVSNVTNVVVYGDVYTSGGTFQDRSGQSVVLNSTSGSFTVQFYLGVLQPGAYYVDFYVIGFNGTQLSQSTNIPFTV